jgi:hypothetical protein
MAILKIEPNVVDSAGDYVFNSANVTANINAGNLFVTGTISAGSNPIENVGTPVAGSDAATKSYVDGALTGISASSISDGDTNVTVVDSGTGNIITTVDNTVVGYVTSTGLYTKGLFWAGNGQVISTGGGGGSGTGLTYTAAATPPASGNNKGDQWYNTTTNVLYEYIYDGVSYYWVDVQTPITGNTNSGYVNRKYTSDGSSASYTVSTGCNVNNVLVYLNGVAQMPTDDYTISGTTLTLDAAPSAGTLVQIRELPR